MKAIVTELTKVLLFPIFAFTLQAQMGAFVGFELVQPPSTIFKATIVLYIIPMKSDADQLLLDKACHTYWSVRLNYVRCLLVLELLHFNYSFFPQSYRAQCSDSDVANPLQG